jgi:hypothetical protein
MVFVRGGGQLKPRIKAKGKVTWIECPEGVNHDLKAGKFDVLKLSIMLKQGATKEETEMLYVAAGDVDFEKPEFAALKKIDQLWGKSQEERQYPLIEFEYYISETDAKDEKGEPLFEKITTEENGKIIEKWLPKKWKNARMSPKDSAKIKILAENSDPPTKWSSKDQPSHN